MAQINVRISEEDHELLKKISKEMDRSISWIVRKAVINFIEQYKQDSQKSDE